MKYLGIAITIIISIFLAVEILSLDYARLTEYGQGYLVGKIVLLLISLGITVFLAMRIVRQRALTRE